MLAVSIIIQTTLRLNPFKFEWVALVIGLDRESRTYNQRIGTGLDKLHSNSKSLFDLAISRF